MSSLTGSSMSQFMNHNGTRKSYTINNCNLFCFSLLTTFLVTNYCTQNITKKIITSKENSTLSEKYVISEHWWEKKCAGRKSSNCAEEHHCRRFSIYEKERIPLCILEMRVISSLHYKTFTFFSAETTKYGKLVT